MLRGAYEEGKEEEEDELCTLDISGGPPMFDRCKLDAKTTVTDLVGGELAESNLRKMVEANMKSALRRGVYEEEDDDEASCRLREFG